MAIHLGVEKKLIGVDEMLRSYRMAPNNPNFMIEMFGKTGTPTGRIFRKVEQNENLTGKEVINIRDSLSGVLIPWVYSHNA